MISGSVFAELFEHVHVPLVKLFLYVYVLLIKLFQHESALQPTIAQMLARCLEFLL